MSSISYFKQRAADSERDDVPEPSTSVSKRSLSYPISDVEPKKNMKIYDVADSLSTLNMVSDSSAIPLIAVSTPSKGILTEQRSPNVSDALFRTPDKMYQANVKSVVYCHYSTV